MLYSGESLLLFHFHYLSLRFSIKILRHPIHFVISVVKHKAVNSVPCERSKLMEYWNELVSGYSFCPGPDGV